MTVRRTLSHRYIKRFYLARFVSNFGNGMGPIALAFGILHLPHGSAKELGFVLGSLTVAMLCMLPFLSNFALITGTAVGGYLVSAFGSTLALFIDALTFIISGALVISFRHLTPARIDTGASIRTDLREGWRVFSSYPWIVITVAGFSFIVMVWAGAQDVLGPVISLKHFHGAKSWAIVITCESIGSGGALPSRTARRDLCGRFSMGYHPRSLGLALGNGISAHDPA